MSHQLPQALAALGQFDQFVLYKIIPKGNGKSDKRPLDPNTLLPGGITDPKIWMPMQTAMDMVMALGKPYGLGFALTPQDPFFFVDIDSCLQGNGQWSPMAQDLLNLFQGAGVEVSQSGKGLHIIGKAHAPAGHRCRNEREFSGLELYTQERLIALTGLNTLGDANRECTLQLDQFLLTYMPPVTDAALPGSMDWTDTPDLQWAGPTDDKDLIERAMKSSSAGSQFGDRATFADLWTGNAEKLSMAYPSSTPGQDFDHSMADAALAQHLAFWTGKNCERMLSLMFQSGLVREKWERPDYLRERTIPKAVSQQTTVYTGRKNKELTVPDGAPAEGGQGGIVAGTQFMTAREQLDYFKGCVYVRDQDRVFVPDGGLLKSSQFRVFYGGYTFALDNSNIKTTKSAWEAFTESQAVRHPIASCLGFRPDNAPGQIHEEEGRMILNAYVPITTRQMEGDAAPFYDWFARALPVQEDRDIIWAYMASLVQNPGVKFQWWPFIQGAEGNGKTLLFRVLSHCVGHRYTHLPNANDIANVFNGWVMFKLFIGVEEIYVSNKREMMDSIKTIITNDRMGMQFKGADQFTGDNRANGIACSNHQEAVAITFDTRRWAAFFCAQQTAQDLIRDGMTGRFFPDLYGWLNKDGYAILNHHLRSYSIPKHLDPAVECVVAPRTSSTMNAVVASRGAVEQEIIEAIEQDRPGFKGGWVSSIALTNLLEAKRIAQFVAPSKRRQLMQKLGYDWHPALLPNEGRVSGNVVAESGKPKLFIRHGHEYLSLTNSSDILAAYSTEQGYNQVVI